MQEGHNFALEIQVRFEQGPEEGREHPKQVAGGREIQAG